MTGLAKRPLQIGTGTLTGIIALSAYAGVFGLVGGGISPFHPTYLGLAILVLICGWLLERASRADLQAIAGLQAEPQVRSL
jgi:hypothetical protein